MIRFCLHVTYISNGLADEKREDYRNDDIHHLHDFLNRPDDLHA